MSDSAQMYVGRNLTTTELIDKYFEITELLQETGEKPDQELLQAAANIEKAIMKKVDNIDQVIVRKREMSAVIKAQIDVYKEEIKRLKRKQETMEHTWEFLKGLIKELVSVQGQPNASGNLQLRTPLRSYTLIKGYGPLKIIDHNKIPDNLMKVEVKPQVKKIRETVIEAGGETEYAKCRKVQRLVIR